MSYHQTRACNDIFKHQPHLPPLPFLIQKFANPLLDPSETYPPLAKLSICIPHHVKRV